MKRHLNTLYVMTEGAYLACEGETVLVRAEKETRLKVPIHMLGGIVCFGRVGWSPALMGLCGERGVALSLLSTNGRFRARIQGPTSGNVLLRREQYRRADDAQESAALARSIVAGKVVNCRQVLLRGLRDHGQNAGSAELKKAADRLARLLRDVETESALDAIRGFEGEAARTYFGVFDHLIKAQKDEFSFNGRSRRPPLDHVNSLLSFLYTLLFHDAASAAEVVGLDPAVGFLHRDKPGRLGLALDLMEEFRPFFGDRLVLSLINKKQLKAGGFEKSESGAVLMDEETRKTVLAAYQKRKQEEITHPFLEEKTTVGLLLHLQARLLARHLRGELDAYPPFFWK